MAVAAAGGGGCPVFPGDAVEIFGLSSEAGKQLNGCKGVATKKIPGTGRFEVRIEADRRVTVKAENLRLIQADGSSEVGKMGFGDADRQAAEEQQALLGQAIGKFGYEPNDIVEVHGLTSESGKDLNGKTGMVMNVAEGGERLEIRIVMERNLSGKEKTVKVVNLKPENIRRPGEKPAVPEPLGHVDLHVDPKEAGKADPNLPVQPGDVVEVGGLTSEAGKPLNGQKGVVLTCLEAEGRAEVRLAKGLKRLKFDNLTKMDWEGGDRVLAEVVGLESESGKQNNGQRGFIRGRDAETGRYDIRINKDKILKLKPENLRLIINEA